MNQPSFGIQPFVRDSWRREKNVRSLRFSDRRQFSLPAKTLSCENIVGLIQSFLHCINIVNNSNLHED